MHADFKTETHFTESGSSPPAAVGRGDIARPAPVPGSQEKPRAGAHQGAHSATGAPVYLTVSGHPIIPSCGH